MDHKVLVHNPKDGVGIAIRDIAKGEKVKCVVLKDGSHVYIEAISDIPLAHKIALKAMELGTEIVEYGVTVGKATQPILKGEHVHVHNMKSARWSSE